MLNDDGDSSEDGQTGTKGEASEMNFDLGSEKQLQKVSSDQIYNETIAQQVR